MNKTTTKIRSILVIDSGIGGLSTLVKAIKQTNANYIYFADNKFSPYGKKSNAYLKNRLTEIINLASKKHDISMAILACNTATTAAIDYLRKTFPTLTIIGTEPAFKVALDKNFKKPALIATPRTIENIKNKVNKKIKLIKSKNLASLIEQYYLFPSPLNSFKLAKELFKVKNQLKSSDSLVLGCTHYCFVKEKLSKITKLSLIDGNDGVSNQISRNYAFKTTDNCSIKIILSDKNSSSMKKYKKILKQILANQIKLW